MTFAEYISKIKDKSIAVIGLGVSNTPLIRRLLSAGCRVSCYDKNTADKLGDLALEFSRKGAELHLGEHYLDEVKGDIIFRTPGMRPDLPALEKAREAGSIVTSEMEVFFRVCPCRIIAVTGSDGKTTTTTIISKMLEAAGYTVHVGGNIGTPLLCQADEMNREDICVLELSSFQLMTMHDSPEIAVMTNLAPNHLDVHKDMEEYTEAKKNIMRFQSECDRFVTNMDHEITRSIAREAKAHVLLFSRQKAVEDGVFLSDHMIYSVSGGRVSEIMDARHIFLPGDHNIENYMAAFAATRGLVDPALQRKVAEEFKGVEHRIEHVRTLSGVDYYNDSIASSPSRTAAGLRAFKEKVILIAGGKDKGVPFDELGGVICKHCKGVVLTGWTAEKLYDAITSAANFDPNMPVLIIDDFKDAVITASKMAKPGDKVILSPACTSFDRFKNFMERGNLFKEIVNTL